VLDLYYRDRSRLEDALELVRQAIQIGEQRPEALPLMVGSVR